jgi:hypothetical protein
MYDQEATGRGKESRATDGVADHSSAIGVNGGGQRERLLRAAESWTRRGYDVRYSDSSLVELARRRASQPLRDLQVALAAALGAGLLAAGVTLALLRWRRWHIISIALTPEHRVLTHARWMPTPPEEALP